ncbi:MAG: tryptophan synthase subunit alpha [Tannerellaceae bacterium]
MNRIDLLFATKQNNILSVYFTAGFPQLNSTLSVLEALQAKGVDMVEIGVPFSDPLADGPVIQQSSHVAIQNGMNLRLLFSQLKDVRERIHIPLVLMTYFNPVLVFGFEEFCKQCAEVGIDGLIIPDLPFAEYEQTYKAITDKYGLHMAMLITPQTSEARIRQIDDLTNGFIYMVSSASTTGAKDRFSEEQIGYFERINALELKNPRLIGFGISNNTTLQSAFSHARGAIVGSKYVQLLGSEKNIEQSVDALFASLGL